MCMEVTFMCRLLGLSLLALADFLLTCSGRASVTATMVCRVTRVPINPMCVPQFTFCDCAPVTFVTLWLTVSQNFL